MKKLEKLRGFNTEIDSSSENKLSLNQTIVNISGEAPMNRTTVTYTEQPAPPGLSGCVKDKIVVHKFLWWTWIDAYVWYE